MQRYPLSAFIFSWMPFCFVVSVAKHLEFYSVKKSEKVHCIVLKQQFDMCFLVKMYILDQSWQKVFLVCPSMGGKVQVLTDRVS